MSDHKDRVRLHYGRWAATYGDPEDDGWFAWVRARESRMVYRELALEEGAAVLDVGCGPGLYAREIASRGHEVWAIDFACEMVERARAHVARAQQGDVETLRLDRTFDRVLCLGVLEWVQSPATALDRLRRHLAPGGRLVVLVPRSGPGGWIYCRQKRKHGLSARLFSPGQLRALGREAGLVYRRHVTPALHNFIMVFEAAIDQ